MKRNWMNSLPLLLPLFLMLTISSSAQKGRPKPPPPPPPSADPAIAYVAERAWSTTDLMVMNADGSNQRVLLAGGSGPTSIGYHNPRWSPDGNWIAFCRNTWPGTPRNGIHVINKDGSGMCKVVDTNESCTYGAGMPQWSPDGNKILYSDSDGSGLNEDLYVIDAKCGVSQNNRLNITNTPDVAEFYPTWSSDGTQIVTVQSNSEGKFDLLLYEVSPDWQQAVFVVNLTATGPLADYGFHDPKWGVTPHRFAASTGDIRVIDVTSPFNPEFTNLTNTADAVERWPGWGPSDQQIVYENDGSIYVMNANGSSPTKIATGSNKIRLNEPDWKRTP